MEIDLSAESRQKSRMSGEAMVESSCTEDLPLIPLMMRILANRQPAGIAQLAKKLNTEGIRQAPTSHNYTTSVSNISPVEYKIIHILISEINV